MSIKTLCDKQFLLSIYLSNWNIIATFVTAKQNSDAMSRPIKTETAYKVTLHINGGYRYASTRPRVITEAGKPNSNKSRHWGTVTEDLKFIPNRRYIYAPIEERRKIVFPEGWDMSEVDKLVAERGAGRPKSADGDKNRLYGATWLLEQIAVKTGLREDLEETFDGNKDMANDFLTAAMFPYITNFTYNRLARWQNIEKSPSSSVLTPTDITLLTQKITERHRMKLLSLHAKRIGDQELCAVDSTSRTAYGDSLTDIRWGHNKEGLALPQTLEVVVYSLLTHMPIYYRTFPGNMPDSRSIETVMTDMEHAGFKNVVFITDRGYTSVQNIERYILKDQRAIMSVKVGLKMVSDRIRELGAFSTRPDGMSLDRDNELYYKQYDIDYEINCRGGSVKRADRMKLNLYFDPSIRGDQIKRTDIKVSFQKEGLDAMISSGETVTDEKAVRKDHDFYDIELNEDKTVKSYTFNQKRYDDAILTFGFFANITLKLDLTPPQALEDYRIRDEQEKYFQQMKSEVASDRQRNWSEDGKTGRLLILFASLIMSSYLRHIWKTTPLKKQFSSSLDILDEMRSIRCVEHKGHAMHITPFVGAQIDICNAFGFQIPQGCEPAYKSKKVEKRRGRPRKIAEQR